MDVRAGGKRCGCCRPLRRRCLCRPRSPQTLPAPTYGPKPHEEALHPAAGRRPRPGCPSCSLTPHSGPSLPLPHAPSGPAAAAGRCARTASAAPPTNPPPTPPQRVARPTDARRDPAAAAGRCPPAGCHGALQLPHQDAEPEQVRPFVLLCCTACAACTPCRRLPGTSHLWARGGGAPGWDVPPTAAEAALQASVAMRGVCVWEGRRAARGGGPSRGAGVDTSPNVWPARRANHAALLHHHSYWAVKQQLPTHPVRRSPIPAGRAASASRSGNCLKRSRAPRAAAAGTRRPAATPPREGTGEEGTARRVGGGVGGWVVGNMRGWGNGRVGGLVGGLLGGCWVLLVARAGGCWVFQVARAGSEWGAGQGMRVPMVGSPCSDASVRPPAHAASCRRVRLGTWRGGGRHLGRRRARHVCALRQVSEGLQGRCCSARLCAGCLGMRGGGRCRLGGRMAGYPQGKRLPPWLPPRLAHGPTCNPTNLTCRSKLALWLPARHHIRSASLIAHLAAAQPEPLLDPLASHSSQPAPPLPRTPLPPPAGPSLSSPPPWPPSSLNTWERRQRAREGPSRCPCLSLAFSATRRLALPRRRLPAQLTCGGNLTAIDGCGSGTQVAERLFSSASKQQPRPHHHHHHRGTLVCAPHSCSGPLLAPLPCSTPLLFLRCCTPPACSALINGPPRCPRSQPCPPSPALPPALPPPPCAHVNATASSQREGSSHRRTHE